MSRVVVVMGMHRSGTSALTRGLSVLGANSGDRLLPPVPGDNDKGFWEDADIQALNVDLMSSLGHRWDSLAPIEPSVLTAARIEPFLERACVIVREKTHGVPVFAIKDPRISRLLPFWRNVFRRLQLSASCVIALRNPLAVARSLERRDGFDVAKSVYLWLLHMYHAVHDSQGLARLIVQYDDVLTHPHEQLVRIATALRLPTPDAGNGALREYSDAFLEVSLRHAHHSLADLEKDARVPPIVVDFYRLLMQASTGDVDLDGRDVAAGLRQVWTTLENLGPLLSFARQSDAELLARASRSNERRTVFQVFPHVAGRYSESTACGALLDLDTAQRIVLELPHGSPTGPIRIDPADIPSMITIDSLVVKRASDGKVVDSWTEPDAIRAFTPAADLVRLPEAHAVSFLSKGTDPQLHLPARPVDVMDQPLVLEATLCVESQLSAAIATRLVEQAMEARRELSDEQHRRQAAEAEAASLRDRSHTAESLLAARDDEVRALQGDVGRLEREIQRQRHEVDALYGSRSWRATVPLRLLAKALREMR